MTAICLRALTKIFGAFPAVRALDLEIADGEFFSFLGPSGCGKTTTLRMIAGLERPTGGGVWFSGREMTEVPPQHRNVGLVFQSYAVFPTMTVFENVAYGLRVRHVSPAEIRRRVTSFLQRLSLDAFASRLPQQLSGGQLQRVALARALVIEPAVLLLDEPLSNLDVKLRVDVRAEIKRLQRDLGITTLYVTHDQEEALTLSDRVGVMHQGRLEQVGRPAEVYQRPATRFVAGFVGEGTLIDVDVSRAGDGWRARTETGFAVVLPASVIGDTGPGWLCIRPEAVRLVPESASADTFPAVIEHVEFAGPVVRADLRVDGLPGPLRATRPATDVVVDLTPGDTVRVALDASAIAGGRRGGIS